MNIWSGLFRKARTIFSGHKDYDDWCRFEILPDNFKCGHERNESNTYMNGKQPRCRECHRQYYKRKVQND